MYTTAEFLQCGKARNLGIDEYDGFDRLKNIYACGRAGWQNNSWKLNFLYPLDPPHPPFSFHFSNGP